MKPLPNRRLLCAALVCAFAASPALAERERPRGHLAPPPHAAPAPAHAPAHAAPSPRNVREEIRISPHPAHPAHVAPPPTHPAFTVRERTAVRDYYAPYIRRGECPPGMRFERGRCYPNAPRRWVIGQPLPPTVIIEPVPVEIIRVLPPPPPQYHYGFVAGDILLLAAGTNMVIDALQDLFD